MYLKTEKQIIALGPALCFHHPLSRLMASVALIQAFQNKVVE